MNLRHLLLALFMLVGCSQPEIDPPQPPPKGEYTPRPAEPEVDKTFMDATAVASWRAKIAADIEKNAAVPHPREVWRYAADFKVDRRRPDPILGDPSIWDAAKVAEPGTDYGLSPDAPAPSADEALALEAQDHEWAAADIWIALNRLNDAKRCGKELEKEGEWKAVAMIAVHTGDLVALDRATKKMVGANQMSRTREVAKYAFEQGKIDIAKHIATTHGWKISEIVNPFQVRELALKGDVSILREFLDREVNAWEKNDVHSLPDYPGPETIVADIAILEKTDKVKAKEYAARYLKLNTANVLIWTQCGEGCYSTSIPGALELYQLVHSDTSLRELYFARLRQSIDYMFPVAPKGDERPTTTIAGLESNGYSGWSTDIWGYGLEGTLLTSYLLRVRQMGDGELTRFWVEMLDTFQSRSGMDGSLDFERQLGRCALGLPFYQSVGDITPTQKFVLEELRGGSNIQMEDTWTDWYKELPSYERRREIEYLFQVLTRGEVSPSREVAIRAELGIETVPGQEESLRSELHYKFRESIGVHYGDWEFRWDFGKAQEALRTNVRAQGLRRDRGLPTIELYPDTDAEYDELMAPSLALLCEKFPEQCQLWPRLTAPVTVVPELTPVEEPAPVASASPAALTTTSPSAEPTNCTFVNGSRPQVGEKYVVTCEGGTFLANAEYKGGGVFAFSALTPHTP